ncbi:MAG: HlyD family efflux transporter periplasmic adaptor subunit [Acidaminococcaceae bacterium]|nr:HlyD family efflux transporter periplasmic adaptor subunit [Acidaminococcaceae bacterium]
MKKLCMVILLVCLILTAACGKPEATDKNIRLQGRTEAVLYTVKAPVDGEIRGLILDAGERIRKGQPLFGLGTQDENPEVEKAATELAKSQARLNNASQGNSEASRASAAAALQSARNEVQNAEQEYNKMKRLYDVGGISRNRLQQAQLNLESARAGLAAAQARYEQVNRAYTPEELAELEQQVQKNRAAYDATILTVEGSEIVSPSTGTVRQIWARNGEAVKKEQPVMQIVSATDCTILVRAKTADPRLTEGTEATVTVPGSKKDFPAVIRKIEQNTVTLFSSQKPEELPEGTDVEVTIKLKENPS